MTAFPFKVKQNVDGLKIEFIYHLSMGMRIYQQRFVFIECVQVAGDGDSILIDEVTFVSL